MASVISRAMGCRVVFPGFCSPLELPEVLSRLMRIGQFLGYIFLSRERFCTSALVAGSVVVFLLFLSSPASPRLLLRNREKEDRGFVHNELL